MIPRQPRVGAADTCGSDDSKTAKSWCSRHCGLDYDRNVLKFIGSRGQDKLEVIVIYVVCFCLTQCLEVGTGAGP